MQFSIKSGLSTSALFFVISICFIIRVQAQLDNSHFDGETQIKLFIAHTSVKNVWSERTTEEDQIGGFRIHFGFSKSNFTEGLVQRSHRIPIMGDLLLPGLISPLTKSGVLDKKEGVPILTSFLGWHNFAWTLYGNDRVQVAGGFHTGDYFYGIEPISNKRRDENRNVDGSTYWYYSLGPSVIIDVALIEDLIFHYEGAFAFTLGYKPLPPDEKPNLLNQTFEIRYIRYFFNLELVHGLNSWGNRINRTQFGLGFSF